MKIVDAEYLGERGEYRYWQFKVVDGEKVFRIGASLLRTFWSLCDQVRGRSSHARQRRQPRTHRISGVIAMTAWNDFNDADSQQSGFDLIPKGTVVPVRMTIKPGGYDDPEQCWGGGYATESFETGSIYLAAMERELESIRELLCA